MQVYAGPDPAVWDSVFLTSEKNKIAVSFSTVRHDACVARGTDFSSSFLKNPGGPIAALWIM
jgi:hypothetical protein